MKLFEHFFVLKKLFRWIWLLWTGGENRDSFWGGSRESQYRSLTKTSIPLKNRGSETPALSTMLPRAGLDRLYTLRLMEGWRYGSLKRAWYPQVPGAGPAGPASLPSRPHRRVTRLDRTAIFVEKPQQNLYRHTWLSRTVNGRSPSPGVPMGRPEGPSHIFRILWYRRFTE